MKRTMDIVLAVSILCITSPLMLVTAIGVKLSSPGPIFYHATRAGRNNHPFGMLKFRSMHVTTDGPVITAHQDPRVFGFGALIRKLKLDELPQLLNVLRGDMSMVGPRPEDPKIVAQNYTDWMLETLTVRPGVTSPGSVFYYGQGEHLIDARDPEGSYIRNLLPPKLAIERAYMDRATLLSDLGVIALTAYAIAGAALGFSVRPNPRDRALAEQWAPASAFPDHTS